MRFIRINDKEVETFLDTRTNHKFIKNKRGQLFLVNISPKLAQDQERSIVYTFDNGAVAVLANSFERNSVRRLLQKEWERRQLMWYHFLWMIRKESQCLPANQQIQTSIKNGNPWQSLEISICLSASLRGVDEE